MMTSAAIFTTVLDAVDAAVAAVPASLPVVKALDDEALLAMQRRIAAARRALDACASLVAGEVAFRSRPELGYQGLAQKNGFSSPQKLVQSETGSTGRDASTLVVVGAMVHEARSAELADPATGEIPAEYRIAEPWLAAVGAAVSAGALTIDAAKAIRPGLGEPSVDAAGAGVSADDLAGAAGRLLVEASELNADALFKLARQLRDELDASGIAIRERLIYEQRSFRRSMRPNGLPRYTIDPDIETAAYLDDLYDKLTSPRRNGPRFVDPEASLGAEHPRRHPHDRPVSARRRSGTDPARRRTRPEQRRSAIAHRRLAHSRGTGTRHRDGPGHRGRRRPHRGHRPAGIDRHREPDRVRGRNPAHPVLRDG